MGRAIIKHRKPKNLGRGKLYDKAINTRLEKRIQQIAKNEVDKNKKQKLLCTTLLGKVQYPTISSESAAGDNNYYVGAKWALYAAVYRNNLRTQMDGNTYTRNIYEFPQIRINGAEDQMDASDIENVKKYGTNADIIYKDNDELGNVRAGDEIHLKGFKLSGKIIPNVQNVFKDNVIIECAVYKCDVDFLMRQRTAQYMLIGDTQEGIFPKRLINDYLGSFDDGEPKRPDTQGIKKRIFYKKWIINSKQDLHIPASGLSYVPKVIRFSYYVETNQKIKYVRGQTSDSGGETKISNVAYNQDSNNNNNKIEFENCKYVIVTKSNIESNMTNQEKISPFMSLQLTNYFTDLL